MKGLRASAGLERLLKSPVSVLLPPRCTASWERGERAQRQHKGQPRSRGQFGVSCVAASPVGIEPASNSGNGSAPVESPNVAEQLDSAAADNSKTDWSQETLSVVVVGASGDLARKKIYPALFALYVDDMLPENFTIYGYARSKMSDEEFRDYIAGSLTCRVTDEDSCGDKFDTFLERCYYQPGQYAEESDFKALSDRMSETEKDRKKANRIFYLSIPPSIFTAVAGCASQAASSPSGWTRVIVEKPFGKDSESFAQLERELSHFLSEEQMYRIDHYLGKELIENLTVLRFANLVFEPLWSRNYIRNVQVIFSEDFGTEGRGGYFDQYGIIRDVIQNHLLQIVSLFAMEAPVSLDAEHIRNEKVKVLQSMKQLSLDDVVIGQYRGRQGKGVNHPGYLDDDTVPPGSLCPTFAAVALFINNARWDGVPFLLKAGKALASRRTEIRVQFRHVPGNLFRDRLGLDLDRATNELVMRIQPDEAIYLKINNKIPGLGMKLDVTKLDLTYKQRYNQHLPDAYERLILDVVNGDKRLYIRNDELDAAWALFTPILKRLILGVVNGDKRLFIRNDELDPAWVLFTPILKVQEIEQKKVQPELYPYGSRGPVGSHYLASKYGVRWGDILSADE